MAFILCTLGAGLLALLVLSPWGGREQPVHADLVGADCTTGEGSFGGAIDVFANSDKTGTVGRVVKGTIVYFQVGASVPDALTCAAFDVDVYIKLPGAATFTFVCTLDASSGFPNDRLDPGAAPRRCPTLIPYTTLVADKLANLKWRADLSARGNMHNVPAPDDCVLSDAQKNPNLSPGPQGCFEAGGSSFVLQATQTPTPTATATDTATPTATGTPVVKPIIKKLPNLVNLWLCSIRPFSVAPGCDNKGSGVEEVNIPLRLNSPVISREPKCVAEARLAGTDPNACPRQSIGAFEFEVRYDAKLVSVRVLPGPLLTHPDVDCATVQLEGIVQFRCVTEGKTRIEFGPGILADVRVRATADVYSIIIANQLNGIATQLINQGCQLADLQGHDINIDADSCNDADVTIRYLEGDIHADCTVDVLDSQQIAFRWGSRLGNLLYNSRMDLEPSQPKKGDGDIDAKDLQFIYGRDGSTCKAPHPVQDPVDPKAKPPLPPL
jgi:hypothetical protein